MAKVGILEVILDILADISTKVPDFMKLSEIEHKNTGLGLALTDFETATAKTAAETPFRPLAKPEGLAFAAAAAKVLAAWPMPSPSEQASAACAANRESKPFSPSQAGLTLLIAKIISE